ncbi:MAG: sugar phosphate nucleotidyltransferase [Bacteroidota bacterium]
MKAIIPVAGVGSRLRPHTYTLPKVLLNVAGKPIIGHIIDKLIETGIDNATVIVGYMGDKIREYITNHYDIHVDFVEQEERFGLGHSIYIARETLPSEPVLIILGDTIFDVDLVPIIKQNESALGVKWVEDPRRFGIAEVDHGYIKNLIEKPEHPTSNLALVGLYYITNTRLLIESVTQLVKENIRTKNEYQLTDALQLMISKGERIKTFHVEGWYDCGKPETLLETNRHLLDKYPSKPSHDGIVVIPPVFISKKCTISHSVIGPYATIADGAVVRDAIIRNSIISEDAQVQGALLENSIVGNNATVRGVWKRINVGDSSEIDFF